MRFEWVPPMVFRMGNSPPKPVMDVIQELADELYAGEYQGETQIDTRFDLICASQGAVGRHTDDFPEARGKWTYGLVLRSDDHVLHVEGKGSFPLRAGDVYCIDPFTPHWTTCPDDTSEIIFAVSVEENEGKTPVEIANDFRWAIMGFLTGGSQGG